MGTNMIRQTMFTTGEVDVVNYNRTDFKDYLTAAQRLQNVEVGTTGLAKKRKGTQFDLDVTAYGDPNAQLYEFIDANGETYILMAVNNAIYIFSVIAGVVALYSQPSSGPNPLVTTYLSADIPNIDYANDNDVVIFTHPSYAPSRVFSPTYVGGLPLFEFATITIYPAPAYDFNNINYNNFTVSASVNTGVTPNVLTFAFTGLASDPGYTSAWIGGQIIGAGASTTDPIGYAIITNVVTTHPSTYTVTFTATVQVAFGTTFALIGSQYSVRQPLFTADLGYPAKVLFYQNRLWFGNFGSLNNTVAASRLNQPINFDVGVGADTDAIIYTIGQSNSGDILWMNGGKQFEIYTENFEFAAPQEQQISLTPSTFSIRQQSAYGSTNSLKPVTYINDSYYVSKTGTAIINYRYDGIGQTYTSTNVSAASSHLVKNPINRALTRGTDQSQDNFIYFLNSDNTITAFQFVQEVKLAALTEFTFSVADVDSVYQNTVHIIDIMTLDNVVYLLKYYTLTNKYVIESFVDTATKLDSFATFSMDTDGNITGLDAYNGYMVQIVYPLSSGGKIYPQDLGLGTADGDPAPIEDGATICLSPQATTVDVLVGFLYPMTITPMYIFAGTEGSNYFKTITRIYVDYYNSLNFYVDGTLVNFQIFNPPNSSSFPNIQPTTGTVTIYPALGYSQFNTFSITQNAPFDCQITGIAYQVSASII